MDIVTGYIRRRAIPNRSQAAVFQAIEYPASYMAYEALGDIHSETVLRSWVATSANKEKLMFTCSRPYRKNDNAHAEQKNR